MQLSSVLRLIYVWLIFKTHASFSSSYFYHQGNPGMGCCRVGARSSEAFSSLYPQCHAWGQAEFWVPCFCVFSLSTSLASCLLSNEIYGHRIGVESLRFSQKGTLTCWMKDSALASLSLFLSLTPFLPLSLTQGLIKKPWIPWNLLCRPGLHWIPVPTCHCLWGAGIKGMHNQHRAHFQTVLRKTGK